MSSATPVRLLVKLGATLVLSALLLPSAWAFRCNSYVIDAGLHKQEVLQKCGQPSSRDQAWARRIVRLRLPAPAGTVRPLNGMIEVEREVLIQVEEWVYNFGPQQFMQLLVFEDGQLRSVKDLSYGS